MGKKLFTKSNLDSILINNFYNNIFYNWKKTNKLFSWLYKLT